MYKQDLALNNQRELICRKMQPANFFSSQRSGCFYSFPYLKKQHESDFFFN